jgi:large subunit ribosomal protein L14
MIQKGTKLLIADNSGGKTAECIHVYGGYKKRYGYFGNQILVAIKSLRKKGKNKNEFKVKRGDVSKGILVQIKHKNKIDFSTVNFFYSNFVVLISKQDKYVGTRVFIPLERNLRYTKYLKLLSVCTGIIQ